MPTDLDDLFTALGRQADAIPLPPAEAARRRGQQRTRTQAAVAAAVVVCLVVAGVAGLLNRPGQRPDQAVAPTGPLPDVGSPISLGGTVPEAGSAAAGGRVFTVWQNADDTLHLLAADLHTGARLWEAERLGEPGAMGFLRAVESAVVLTTAQATFVYRPEDGKLLWKVAGAEGDVVTLHKRALIHWSGTDQRLVAYDWSGRQRWSRNAPATAPVWVSTVHRDGELYSVDPTDDRLLQIGGNGQVRVVNVDTGEIEKSLTVPDPSPNSMLVSYEGWLITQDTANRVRATNLRTGESAVVYSAGDGHSVTGMDFCDTDRLCLLDEARDRRNTLIAIDVPGRRQVWRVPTLDGQGRMLSSNGRGHTFVGGGRDTVLYDANGREVLRSTDTRSDWLTPETLLRTAAGPGMVELVRVTDGHVTPLGEVPQRTGMCAWTTERLACTTPTDLRIWSLTG